MLDNATVLAIAEILLDKYRVAVVIDPTIRVIWKIDNLIIPVEIKKSQSPLTWEATLSVAHHTTTDDVKQSVVQVLATILTNELEFIDHPALPEARRRIECKLMLTLDRLLPSPEALAEAEDQEAENGSE